MKYLFSRASMAELKRFLEKKPLLAFDFDGTLVPIVNDPKKAVLDQQTAAALAALSRKFSVVLISGRNRADLKKRSPLRLRGWIGNHGAEGTPGKKALATASKKVVNLWEKQLLEKLSRMPGVSVENKKYSLTVHYRSSANPTRVKNKILETAGTLSPPPLVGRGKRVINLTLAGQPNKGDALLALLKSKKYATALFVGDDVTDEDIFSLEDPRIFSIRIGYSQNSAARTFLKNQEEIFRFLGLLLS